MNTVKVSEVSTLAMASGNEKRISRVIHEGDVKHWVGIGWVVLRKATEEDLAKYPMVVPDAVMNKRPRRLKTYIALSVYLNRVPRQHVAANGARQFTILCRACSQKEVAELVGGVCRLSDLRNFSGIREAPEAVGFLERRVKVADVVKKDRVIYYELERSGEWFEYCQRG